jgi:peptidoglycan/xylan/chitin deacetylase (PgdA/CDA1 family)
MLPLLQRLGHPATLYVPTFHVATGEPVTAVLAGYLAAKVVSRAQREAVVELLSDDAAADGDRPLDDRLREWLERMPNAQARHDAMIRVAEALGLDLNKLVATGAFSLMTPQALKAAAEAGIDIQLHTHSHTMHDMDAAKVADEIRRNREELSCLLSLNPAQLIHFCYPSGEYRYEIFSVLDAQGVVTATTTEFGLAVPGQSLLALPRILDGELLHDLELEARLSGFWSVLVALRMSLRSR